MTISRRKICVAFLLASSSGLANSVPFRRRRVRRRTVRRRVRRPVAWRVVGGRRRLIVPLAVAVGWELVVDNKVVVVKEVHREKVVVVDSSGNQTEVDIQKEDTPENMLELEGSEYEIMEEE